MLTSVFSAGAGTVSGQEHMPPSVAESLGLVEAYTATISAPAGASTISDVLLHRHESRPDLYVELVEKAAQAEPEVASKDSAAMASSKGKVLARWAYVPDD
ncbi:MAG: hypothetical protein AAF664_25315, partial [Planctomycetota bacterium]